MVGALPRLLILSDQREFACLMSVVAERLRFATRILPHVLDLEYVMQHWRPDITAVHMAMAGNQDVEALEYLEGIGFAGRLLLTGDVSEKALKEAAAVARSRGLDAAFVLTTQSPVDQVETALRQLFGLERAA